MHSLFKALLCISFCLLCVEPAPAADPIAELPSADQIRDYYEKSNAQWAEVPQMVLLAFVAAQDRNFFENIAPKSTITQQIGRWYSREGADKFQRLTLSFLIADALSHEEILNWYANQIYLGLGCFGVTDAAFAYFGKSLSDLRHEEAAYLAAAAVAPAAFHPLKSNDRAINGRNFVLSEMLKAGFISEVQATKATQTELTVRDPLKRCEFKQQPWAALN